jgi:hypothetical protein
LRLMSLSPFVVSKLSPDAPGANDLAAGSCVNDSLGVAV